MSQERNIIAIGRSRYLYDGIRHVQQNGYRVCAIITEEAYEEYDIKQEDFEKLAAEIGAAFFVIRSLDKPELLEILEKNQVRAAISANWKYTIPAKILDRFPCGILNYHLGNLPDYKGNATVNWTIINGEPYINGNIHKMDPELDAGDIIARAPIPISGDIYIRDILVEAEKQAPALYKKALDLVWDNPGAYDLKGSVNGLRCYPRLPEDSQINWQVRTEEIVRLVRASSEPYKGAYSFLNGEQVIIWRARVHFPENRFLAIPGHVVEIRKDKGSVLVAAADAMVEVQEIEVSGQRMPAADYIKSIRVRFKQQL